MGLGVWVGGRLHVSICKAFGSIPRTKKKKKKLRETEKQGKIKKWLQTKGDRVAMTTKYKGTPRIVFWNERGY
jgi:hypothetical protein